MRAWRIPASQHEGVGGKGLRRGHVLAGDVTSGGSSLVGGVGHSASTGLAGAGGRSRYRRASRRWMDQYPYRVGWSRGCNESERSDGPSARRLRYSRDVVFERPRCLDISVAWPAEQPPIQNEQRGTNSRRQDQSVPPFKDGYRLIVRPGRPCCAMAKDATWILQI